MNQKNIIFALYQLSTAMKFKFDIQQFTYKMRVVIISVASLFVVMSLLYTNNLARSLKAKEQHDVKLWAHAMELLSQDMIVAQDSFIEDIVGANQNIPFVLTDENLNVVKSHLVAERVIEHPGFLRHRLEHMSKVNNPIVVKFMWSQSNHILFYGRSSLLNSLFYFPYIQICIILFFILLGYVAIRSSKRDEQNRVWIGLAKETAHQLGTPTSSLLGWIEYLRTQPVDQSAVEEMNKDLSHLMKIVDRFSKIGSETPLTPMNVNEVVGGSVMYFKTRIPRNVSLEYNGLAIAPVKAQINVALYEWVIENLMKNSLDALQGHGVIEVHISADDEWVMVDVKDTGKGIPKSNWKKIFEPGFTTKTRGWGLGLSLSRRVIEEYHFGKIAVIDSEIGKGTTIRVTLKRYFE